MDEKRIVGKILEHQGEIHDVFFLACGGSLVDIYPASYFVERESRTIHALTMTAREFIMNTPKTAGRGALAILCSHGGSTPEVLEAANLAKMRGMELVTFTHSEQAPVSTQGHHNIIYGWGDHVSVADRCPVQSLSLMNELLAACEKDYGLYQIMKDSVDQINDITREAMRLAQEPARLFAQKYEDAQMIYVLGSGASFANAYGFSICSLMEMLWMHSSYIHSGEFFHGPFEVTEDNPVFLLLMNCGKTRQMDQRVLDFLQQHAEKYEVLDSMRLGGKRLNPQVSDYFTPIMFYYLSCVYREAMAKQRGHSLDERRYMWKMSY